MRRTLTAQRMPQHGSLSFRPGNLSHGDATHGMPPGGHKSELGRPPSLKGKSRGLLTTNSAMPAQKKATDADEDSTVWGQLFMDGIYSLLYEVSKPTQLYRPVACLLVLWECVQLVSFSLSATPVLPWRSIPFMADVANALQIISFGYYIPAGTGIATAEFAVMFAIACVTLLLTAVLGIAAHPALEDNKLDIKWAYTPLRWLLTAIAQCLYLPMIMQLISSFRCSATTPFLDSATCWGPGHVVLAVMSGILLPCMIGLAAVSVTTLFDFRSNSKDPFARPHGRTLLVLQLIKLAAAVLFAIDDAVDKWPLVVGCILLHCGALFVVVMYLPFHWQRLNELAAAGYGGGVATAAVMILVAARGTSLSSAPSWVLLYTVPWSALSGFILASLQWNHWLGNPTIEVTNVYQLELLVRHLVCTNASEAGYDQADAMFSEALRFFPSASIIHMFIAQYMSEIRNNQHLERMHLTALAAKMGPLDETFFAYLCNRRTHDLIDADDQRTVSARVKFEKLKASLREEVLACRRLQVALWAELIAPTPSPSRTLRAAARLRDKQRKCQTMFQQLLVMNANSVQVVRMYAQYMREIANNRTKADELLEQASEIEAMQARAQTAEVDFIFMAKSDALDASQDNVGLLSVAPTGEVLDANPVFLQMLGYTKREILGLNINRIIPEPIASVHHRFLTTYQETGRGIMINVTRTLFAVHKGGFIAPIQETMRALDNCFSAVAQPLTTSDNFIMVAMPAFAVTGLCQRTMVRTTITTKQLKESSVSVLTLMPTFMQLWEEHKQAILEYESAAMADHEDPQEQRYSVLTLPTSIVYMVPIQLKVLGDSTDQVTVNAKVRLQLVKVTDCAFIVVKWNYAEPTNDPHVPTRQHSASITSAESQSAHGSGSGSGGGSPDDSNDEHDAASDNGSDYSHSVSDAGSLFEDGDDPDAAHRLLTHHNSLTLGGAGESKSTPVAGGHDADDAPTPTRTVKFSEEASASPKPRTRRHSPTDPIEADIKRKEKQSAVKFSGRSSQGSSTSSTMYSTLHRLLARTVNTVSPAVSALDRAVVALLCLGGLIVIGNYVYANVVFQDTTADLNRVVQVGDRLLSLQAASIRMQDVVLHTEGFVPLTADYLAAMRSELTAKLLTMEQLHRTLYSAAESDPVANAKYTANTLPMDLIDEFGRVRTKNDNALNAGIALISEARLALQASASDFTRSSTHVWFVFRNLERVRAVLADFLNYYTVSAVSSLSTMDVARGYILIAVLIGLSALSLAVLLPMLARIHKSRDHTLSVFLDVPIQVLRALHRQSENWLTEAVHASDEDDDEAMREIENDLDKDGNMPLSAVLEAAAQSRAENREFAQERMSLVIWMATLFIPIIVLISFLIVMYFWGHSIAVSQQQFAVEHHSSMRLAFDAPVAYYALRKAFLESNATLAPAAWNSVTAGISDLSTTERLFTIGKPAGEFSVEGRSALRLAALSTLFLHNGCPSGDDGCLTFYDSIFQSGLHSVIAQAVHIMEQTVVEQQSRHALPYSATYVAGQLQSRSLHAVDVMMHTYLMDALRYSAAVVTAGASDEASVYLTGLVIVMVLALLSMVLAYFTFYRRLFRALDAELRTGQSMVLWLPEEVMQGVPSVKQLMKDLRTS